MFKCVPYTQRKGVMNERGFEQLHLYHNVEHFPLLMIKKKNERTNLGTIHNEKSHITHPCFFIVHDNNSIM